MTVSKVEYSDPKGNDPKGESRCVVTEYTVAQMAAEKSAIIPIEKEVEQIELQKETGDYFALSAAAKTITQGVVKASKAHIDSGVKFLDIKLSWEHKNNKLSLTVYDPQGNVYGPYNNNSGTTIIRINPPTGKTYVPSGYWRFNIYGQSVTGTENYTLSIVGHVSK